MKGSTFRRCYCRDADGKMLSARCPKLSSKRHGTWSLKQELPARKDGSRRAFRRSGYENAGKAQADLDKVRAILDVPEEDDAVGLLAIGDLLESVSKDAKAPIPDLTTIERRFKTDEDLGAHTTVGQWLDEWIENKEGRPTAIARDESNIRLYLKPHLGGRRLDKLLVRHLREMFESIRERSAEIQEQNALRREQQERCRWQHASRPPEPERQRLALERAILAAMPKYGRTVGPGSMQRIRSTLRAALTDAIKEQRFGITLNVASLLDLDWARPKGMLWTPARVERWRATGEKPSPVMVWTPDLVGEFLTYAQGDRLYALYHLIAFRGLRRGEACGVRWEDIDWKAGTLTVAKQLVQNGWDVYEGEPKTDSGARTISLDGPTLAVLREHKKRQAVERKRLGGGWVDDSRVFTREDGSWLRPSDVTATFNAMVRATDLPPVRLHDLRHGAATLMHAGGGDMHYIKATLGHSSHHFTSDVYANLLPEVDKAVAEKAALLVPIGVRRTLGLASVSQTTEIYAAAPGNRTASDPELPGQRPSD